MKNILVAVDLHDNDQLLIAQARTLAEKFHSKIWIIHIATPDPDFVGYEVGPTYIRDTRADQLRREHRLLQSYAQGLTEGGIASEALLIQGPTVEMLREEVVKLKIELLILGSHKHSFLYEAFIGHTAARVIKDVDIPVLIVPLKEE